ncbi:alpha-keto acid decarboxylase family protein [Leuconostoc pseudomesenteroides]|uniref:alpha-keto acid decarboxylase family protein n=1 Tax=Leuconostoc pseudomesenteroides TaxID=33968 RepID=UPI0021AAFCE1|nr:thiamine pyrophosphate-binding protein [Leuconostoc pseudomesenteroides]MCT4388726.1 alpha-keto acid decarboxylase family protein [Leuconostoc pseudomesenteroides]
MYTLSNYILDLIHASGSDHIFGVPGDYNLKFLDYVMDNRDLEWVGNANELNASYMADGYARKRGFAAFVTTFGVGELSAINGLSGSIAEHVPVLEIVGSPTTQVQNEGKLVHHTLGDGQFKRFEKAHKKLGMATAYLTKENAVDEVNRIFKYIATTKKPAYINMPTDLVNVPVNRDLIDHIPEVVSPTALNDNEEMFKKILTSLENNDSTIVAIVGHEISRFRISTAVEKFVALNNIPVTTLGLGKGAINEQFPQFIGTYNGKLSHSSVSKIVDSADIILTFGVKLTDSVTGGFTQSFVTSKTIAINSDSVNIFGQTYTEHIDITAIINQLAEKNISTKSDINIPDKLSTTNTPLIDPSNKPLTQSFYDKAVNGMLKHGQTLVAEQGTSFFGLVDGILPENAQFIGQPLWGSIGYSFPAMLGSQISDRNNRNILSIGEGSLLLTMQEFGVLFKKHLNPIIFIIDNTGYTVERVIHGMDQAYNDVPQLDYKHLPQLFANGSDYKYLEASSELELDQAITVAEESTETPVIITVHMDYNDAPDSLVTLGKLFDDQNQ